MMMAVKRAILGLSVLAGLLQRTSCTPTPASDSLLCPFPMANVPAPSVTPCSDQVNINYVTKTFVLQIYDSCNNPFNGQYVTTLNTSDYPLAIAKTPYGATEFIAHTNINLFQAHGGGVPAGAENAYLTTFATDALHPANQKAGYFYFHPPTGTVGSKQVFTEAYTSFAPPSSDDARSTPVSLSYFGSYGCTGENHVEQFTQLNLNGTVYIGSGCSDAVSQMLSASPMALRAVFTCK